MNRIKIVLADNHVVVRQGLCALIDQQKDMLVIGEADDGLQLLDSIDNYLARQQNRQVEAFLSQAQNLGDLESRLRLLDSKSNHSLF